MNWNTSWWYSVSSAYGLAAAVSAGCGDFEWSSDGLEVVYQHAERDSDEQHKVE